MTDPSAQIAVGLANQATQTARGLLDRVLGPTADVMGTQVLEWYQRKNSERVIRRAASRVDLTVAGQVPPRVVAGVLEQAQWADDEIFADYLSGVLASARTPTGADDRAVSWAALIGRLSSDQIRVHYALYSGFRENVAGRDPDSFWAWQAEHLGISLDSLFATLGWELSADSDAHRLLDALYGLQREGLLQEVSHGLDDYLRDEVSYVRGRQLEPGAHSVVYRVTAQGISLLLTAQGYGGLWVTAIARPDLQIEIQLDNGDRISPPQTKFVTDFPLPGSK